MAEEVDEIRHQLMELQSQFAFQEDALRTLDDALVGQQQEIIQLRRQMELLKQRQDEQAAQHEAGQSGIPVDDKPPHY